MYYSIEFHLFLFTYLTWLLENFKLQVWLALYFCWEHRYRPNIHATQRPGLGVGQQGRPGPCPAGGCSQPHWGGALLTQASVQTSTFWRLYFPSLMLQQG